MDLAILVALIVLNGAFAMSEIALVAAKRSRLGRMAEDGDRGAKRAMKLGEEPTQFLSTVQIGITAIGILNGIFGEAVLAVPLSEWMVGLGVDQKTASVSSTGIVVAGITYVSIVVGELVPKRIAQFNAEGIARLVAAPISLLAQISRPFVFVLSFSTDTILRLLGQSDLRSSNLTEEDIQAVLVEGSQMGVIQKQEHEMLRNVFRLDDRLIASLMTPRSEIVGIDVRQSFDEMIEVVMHSDHSRFPVYSGSLKDLIGVVSTKRLLKLAVEGEDTDSIIQHILPPVFVPESLTGIKLLEHFRQSGAQMVFVVDEYGEVLGLITLQDLLEALAGEFKPRDPEDVWAVQRPDGSWLLDGLIPIPELKDRLNLKSVPEEEKGRYHTLSGMMMWLIGSVPQTGETTVWQDWTFEVVDLDGHRIDKVLAQPVIHEDIAEFVD